jgi:hypothetical protein
MTWKVCLSVAFFVLTAFVESKNVGATDLFTVGSQVQESKPLNDLFSKQWVRLGDDHSIQGQLFELSDSDKRPLNGLPIVLVQNGRIVSQAQADEKGQFHFDQVTAGLYSIVTRTNESFAAFALQVLEPEQGQHLASSIEVRPVRSAGDRVKEILRSQVVPPFLATTTDVKTESNVDPLASERRFAMSHVIKLDNDGNLRGQLAKPGINAKDSNMGGMTIYVLQGNVEVARVEADAEGKFTIAGLSQGVYGFVAAGMNGIAATAFQVVNPALASKGSDGTRLVSINLQDCCPILNCEVVETCEVTCCEPQIVETVIEEPIIACEEPVEEVCVDDCGMAPMCGCGCGSGWGGGYGGGGGGGGLFGGGGFGQLLGLAGLAGIAAVIADNSDDDNGGQNFNQPPIQVSPVQ